MIPPLCPRCGKPGHLMAGRVAFEYIPQHHDSGFYVCWSDNLALKQGEQEWRRMADLRHAKPVWIKHTPDHWQMRIGKELLDYWPTKRKFRWKGQTHVGDVDKFIASIATA